MKDTHGPETLKAIIDGTGDAVFQKPLRIMSWYPYASFIGFLIAVERRVGGGDRNFFRKLGEVAGTRDLGTIFRIYRALASPERLIRSCSRVWASYYRNAGRMEAIAWSPDETTLRIFDFPDMHRAHCQLMEGWMISTMNNLGVQIDPGASETACMSRGGPFHEFRCTWRKR